jgi:diguanylate cyclase (GGDEF)-like protein
LRFLVVDSDMDETERIAQALSQWASTHGQGCRICVAHPSGPPQVCAVSSMAELVNVDLDPIDMVIGASSLADGSALEITAYLRGLRPGLPLLLLGAHDDVPMMLEAIHAGAMDFLLRDHAYLERLPLMVQKSLTLGRVMKENHRLHRELSDSLAELAEKHRELQTAVSQLEATARTDDLTGLCNRRSLKEALDTAWNASLRHGQPLAFLMMDLDGFKNVNDQHGHHRGDELLALTGRILKANCRQVDLPARYGGDEFCVMMPATEAHEAVRVARRLMREFDVAVARCGEWAVGVSMSIGIAHSDLGRPSNAEHIIRQADEAMYAAKAAGKRRLMIGEGAGAFSPVSME